MNDVVTSYVKVFNAAARSRQWSALAAAHAPDGVLEFSGVPLPPVRGREAIEAIYTEYPQAELVVLDSRSDGDVHVVDYKWGDGSGTGSVRLTFQDGLVAHSLCTIDAAEGGDH